MSTPTSDDVQRARRGSTLHIRKASTFDIGAVSSTAVENVRNRFRGNFNPKSTIQKRADKARHTLYAARPEEESSRRQSVIRKQFIKKQPQTIADLSFFECDEDSDDSPLTSPTSVSTRKSMLPSPRNETRHTQQAVSDKFGKLTSKNKSKRKSGLSMQVLKSRVENLRTLLTHIRFIEPTADFAMHAFTPNDAELNEEKVFGLYILGTYIERSWLMSCAMSGDSTVKLGEELAPSFESQGLLKLKLSVVSRISALMDADAMELWTAVANDVDLVSKLRFSAGVDEGTNPDALLFVQVLLAGLRTALSDLAHQRATEHQAEHAAADTQWELHSTPATRAAVRQHLKQMDRIKRINNPLNQDQRQIRFVKIWQPDPLWIKRKRYLRPGFPVTNDVPDHNKRLFDALIEDKPLFDTTIPQFDEEQEEESSSSSSSECHAPNDTAPQTVVLPEEPSTHQQEKQEVVESVQQKLALIESRLRKCEAGFNKKKARCQRRGGKKIQRR